MEPDRGWLADMLSAAREALQHTAGMARSDFRADLKTQRAIELLLVVIGEAAGKITAETRAALPRVPFAEIVRMTNRLVHHYFKTDVDLVWDVVDADLQPRIDDVSAHLTSLGPSPEP